ncbi:hypothetical protein BZG36_02906 [Bifiguratus adelaidae]|uniref:Uncharacterized protein n=1 Tax=Bifiguratus adelaidae TaxID=1938954 RepID=A0A261Y1D9_9FUNG|nr:hypothetical protein BZG36_02906 [Bifiguratus adelaidae]
MATLLHKRTMSTSSPSSSSWVNSARKGLWGFLFGITVAGGTGVYYVLHQHSRASQSLLTTVDDVQGEANKVRCYTLFNRFEDENLVRNYTRKIERLERDVDTLKQKMATQEQIAELKVEIEQYFASLLAEQKELHQLVKSLNKGKDTS